MIQDTFLYRIIIAAAVMTLAYLFSRYLRMYLKKILSKFGADFAAKFSEVTRYFILILGAVVSFSILSLDIMVISIILGGIFILTLISVRDILLNMAAEIYLRVRKPFDEGDWIRVAELEGRVRTIGSLDTEIVASEGERIIIPNSVFLNHPIINKSQAIATYVDVKLIFPEISIGKVESTVRNALSEIRPELLGEPEILSINEKGNRVEVVVTLPIVNLKKLRWLINRLSKEFYRQGIEVEIE